MQQTPRNTGMAMITFNAKVYNSKNPQGFASNFHDTVVNAHMTNQSFMLEYEISEMRQLLEVWSPVEGIRKALIQKLNNLAEL
nr:hypothetical protein [Phyllobacterium salinisoli]